MRIGVDARPLSGNRTGIGNYTLQLLLNLVNQENPHEYFLFAHKEFDLPKELQCLQKVIRTARSGTLWMQYGLPFLLEKYKIDLFWGPNYTIPLLHLSPIKTVLTIHDMVSFIYPKTLPKKTVLHNLYALPLYVKNADWVITDSNSTMYDVQSFLGVNDDRISSLPLGVSESYFKKRANSKNVINSYGLIPNQFILYVGTIEPRKNLETIIKAYLEVNKKLEFLPDLVIIGKKGWGYDSFFDCVQSSKLNTKIHILEYISDEDLACFYQEALMMIYPSLYEGFGLPVLEAMASGLPVITSNVSSLPEVVGDAGLLVNPYSVSELSNAICLLVYDGNLRNEISGKARRRASSFSWKNTANKTREIFDHLLLNKKYGC
ncbi:glycosyltransferase family 4 protein [Fodinisporobacter ferrooxydans]|uniref:Glycosyltransferase family 4 protein n=1 Tax=Fodinisporobacter ferrooxydans TaxID=2901836 RepID=A0ABY4CLV5_9BACL|nr:glycosyltransferase family 4 protein [Alicyclobacillaceae bacterium MYW30-H2]